MVVKETDMKHRHTSLRTKFLAAAGTAGLLMVVAGSIGMVEIRRNQEAAQVSVAPAPSARIFLTNGGVDVAELSAKKGQSVVWESQDGQEHQLALAPGSTDAPGFGGGVVLGDGRIYGYTFDQIGTYYYYDMLHPERVKGIVTVTE
jgi:plastocyanin